MNTFSFYSPNGTNVCCAWLQEVESLRTQGRCGRLKAIKWLFDWLGTSHFLVQTLAVGFIV